MRIYGVRITKKIVFYSILTLIGFAMLFSGLYILYNEDVSRNGIELNGNISFSRLDVNLDKRGSLPNQIVLEDESEYESLVSGGENIDFDESMVVAVFSGEKPTGGYDIRITRIEATDDILIVHATEFSPGEECIVTQALTYPYDIVKIPRTDKEIKFNIIEKTLNC